MEQVHVLTYTHSLDILSSVVLFLPEKTTIPMDAALTETQGRFQFMEAYD